jgi:mono/diheme cytochrome c family protein
MRITSSASVSLLVGAICLSTAAWAQTRVDFGKREYDNNCAVCHGKAGKGDGPYVDLLKRTAPDLTVMARRNGGIFPVAYAYEVIDGSAGSGHGTRDMPVWGQDYLVQAESVTETYYAATYVRSRILALVEYLNRIQAR